MKVNEKKLNPLEKFDVTQVITFALYFIKWYRAEKENLEGYNLLEVVFEFLEHLNNEL